MRKKCFGRHGCWNQIKIKCIEETYCDLEHFLRHAPLEKLLKILSQKEAEKIIKLRQENKVKYLIEELE